MPELQLDAAWALVVAWLLAAVVRGMPQPGAEASYLLRWLFNACQILGTNFDLVVRRDKPSDPGKKPEVGG